MAQRHMLRAIWLDKTERELVRAALGKMHEGLCTGKSYGKNMSEDAACAFTATQISRTLTLFAEPAPPKEPKNGNTPSKN